MMTTQAWVLLVAWTCALVGDAVRPERLDTTSTSSDSEEVEATCEDVAGWTDIESVTCAQYEKRNWCSLKSEKKPFGSEWAANWGVFEDWREPGGYHAGQACCACGRDPAETPFDTSMQAKFKLPGTSHAKKNCRGDALFDIDHPNWDWSSRKYTLKETTPSFVETCSRTCLEKHKDECNYLVLLPGKSCMGCRQNPEEEATGKYKLTTILTVDKGEQCAGWCAGSSQEWSEKCFWDAGRLCGGCARCSGVRACRPWCKTDMNPWSEKCFWDNGISNGGRPCAACDGCSKVKECKPWCDDPRSTHSWAEKCSWESGQACGGCKECSKAESVMKTKSAEEPIGQGSGSTRPLLTFVSVVIVSSIFGLS